MQWPNYKGFSFSCWLRVESFPASGRMGLFSFLSESKKGCLAVLTKDRLLFEVELYVCIKESFFLFTLWFL